MEEEHEGQSRLFVILAIALIGLLVLGLLGIGGVFVIRQNLQEQAALSQPTPTLVIQLPNPRATFTPIKPVATDTPKPTPTSTPVLVPGQQAAVGSLDTPDNDSDAGNQDARGNPIIILRPTQTSAQGADAASLPGQVPETGLGALEIVLIAIGLASVLLIARRMRMSL